MPNEHRPPIPPGRDDRSVMPDERSGAATPQREFPLVAPHADQGEDERWWAILEAARRLVRGKT